MKAFVCDCCGKTVYQVISVNTNHLSHSGNFSPIPSSQNVEGDYCTKCLYKIELSLIDTKAKIAGWDNEEIQKAKGFLRMSYRAFDMEEPA